MRAKQQLDQHRSHHCINRNDILYKPDPSDKSHDQFSKILILVKKNSLQSVLLEGSLLLQHYLLRKSVSKCCVKMLENVEIWIIFVKL